MKKISYFFVTLTILIQSFITLYAQNTAGKEFWMTYGKYLLEPTQINFLQMQIRFVSGSNPTTVTIYFTNLETSFTFNMSANEIYDYILDNTEKAAVYNTVMGITDNSIYIKSTAPITVYSYVNRGQLPEVTNVLPVTALGTEYFQISYFVHSSLHLDAYAVVATRNNTQLYHSENPSVTLDAGEVYYRTANTDMTGICVSANKPVAFFSLHQGANIPFAAHPVVSVPLMQQMPPVHTLGKTFFVPVTGIGKEFVRIVVTQNNTTITQTGGIIQTGVPGAKNNLTNLQAGDFVELGVYIDSAGCYIQTDKPVGVCSYTPSYSFIMVPYLPMQSQCWIPGIEQTVSKAQMAPFVSKEPFFPDPQLAHYALIITPTNTKKNTKVSVGEMLPVNVSGGTWRDNTDAGISFYSMPLPEIDVPYTFTNQAGIIVLGWAVSTTNYPSSYYYLAYSAMRDLTSAFYANDIYFFDLQDTAFCASVVDFRAEIEGKGIEVDSVKWYINGIEEIAERNKLEWNKHFFTGNYKIKMWAHFENGDTISKTGTLVIVSCNQDVAFFVNNVHHSLMQDTTFCNKTVNFRAEIDGFNSSTDTLKWYIDYGSGWSEEIAAQNQITWNKSFENGEYPIKMEIHYDSGETETLVCTFKVQALWIKMRNVRY